MITHGRPFRFEQSFYTGVDHERYLEQKELCSFCGSISIDDAIKAFQTNGVRWSGCDWKYGWPHKFYISIPCEPYRRPVSSTNRQPAAGKWIKVKEDLWCQYEQCKINHYKFYAEHLVDASPEQIKQWNKIVKPITGIGFTIVDGNLRYDAVCRGHQGDGIIVCGTSHQQA